MMMKAVVLEKPYCLNVKEIPIPKVADDEILIKVGACGICGSDVHAYEGHHFMVTYPRVMGHEFAGVVYEIGSAVKDLKPGDKVCAETNKPCGECYLCKNGMARLCKNKIVNGFNENGGLAEYAKIPAVNAILLPDNVSIDDAALAQPMGVGYHALHDRTTIKEGDFVVIIGAGAVGLGAMIVAKNLGARVLVTDLVDFRLEAAMKMGVDYVVNTSKENITEKVMQLTNNVGADCVVECVGGGQKNTLAQAVEVSKCHGVILILGTFSNQEIAINVNGIRAKEIDLRGSHGQYGTYRHCIDIVSSGNANLRPMFTHEFKLDDIEKAFTLLLNRDNTVLKILIKPNL